MKIREELHKYIPGGAHTYSRGDDQFPDIVPSAFRKGKGAYLIDDNGNKILDYGMGLRSVNIGYGDPEIAQAAYEAILDGNNLTKPSLIELEAAKKFCSLIPSVDMVKFAKHGSTVTTAAIKLARAYTNRRYVLIPEEHPFFSFDDWFIGSTVVDKGVLLEAAVYTKKFKYNDIDSVKSLLNELGNDVAAIMLEPSTHIGPCPDNCSVSFKGCKSCPNSSNSFLKQIETICKTHGIVFILDEMITGFRWSLKGAQDYFNVTPDLTTFGKAMANGLAVAALGGKSEIMNLGSILTEGGERVFLVSTTHGAEMSGLNAFLKTVEKIEKEHIIEQIWEYGSELMNLFNKLSKEYGLVEYVYMEGYPCSPLFRTLDKNRVHSNEFRTLFIEKMFEKAVLMPYVSISQAHGHCELSVTEEALKHTFAIYKQAIESNSVLDFINSKRIVKPVFRKFN